MALDRKLYAEIKNTLTKYPILGLTGPRQSGKTTLLRDMLAGYRYVSLENPDNLSFATEDPRGFLSQYDDQIIFDEIQNAPSLFSYLQGIVDEHKKMGQFVLSGSQNFHLMSHITQSLAGRIALFRLFPFQFSEMNAAGWMSDDLASTMTKGFYPALHERAINQDRYYADYIDTYVKRDVSQLVNVQNESDFKKFIKLCATRAGQLLNLSDLGRDIGISHTTVKNWISILETNYILFRLPPYFKNNGKRLVKSQKLYFYDVGLLCHLLNIRKGKLTPTNAMWGSIFENMIVSELVKQNAHEVLYRDYYFWRDSKGHEVDLLFDEGSALYTYEIKSSSTIKQDMFKGLDYFNGISEEEVASKCLIYGGKEAQNRTKYKVLPWLETR